MVALGYFLAGLLVRLISGHGSILLTVVAAVVAEVTIGPLARRLRRPAWSRVVTVLLVAYLFGTVTNLVEALLFIRTPVGLIPLTSLIPALGVALPTALPWYRPPATDARIRVGWSWLWKIPLMTVVWVPVYFVFAAADAPFVHRYYAETGSQFTVPATGVIVVAELLRGLLNAVALGLLGRLLGGTRRRVWFWLALTYSAMNAWLPLIQRADWPYFLRAANLVEITGSAVVYCGIVALVLVGRAGTAE